ncbi:hypothetical protein [Mariniblastus fucicola]|uniref:hypothetical protein n=1 Tax=Mariniblastus fucicola TaxID=980251 RepID=UPI0011DF594B|nr:hypothetical protein [Mariniblastus fucicola]
MRVEKWFADPVVVKLMSANGSARHLMLPIHAAETSLLVAQPSAVLSAGSPATCFADSMANVYVVAMRRRLHVAAEAMFATEAAEPSSPGRLSAVV